MSILHSKAAGSREKPDESGVTLIELMLIVGILGIIYGLGTNFFQKTLVSGASTGVRTSLTQDARIIMDEMKRFIAQASSSTNVGAGAGLQGGSYNYLQLGRVDSEVEYDGDDYTIRKDSSSIVFWINHSQRYQYFLKEGYIFRCIDTDNYSQMSDNMVKVTELEGSGTFDGDYRFTLDWKDPEGNVSHKWIRIRLTLWSLGPKSLTSVVEDGWGEAT
ncbi:MAG TPA: hypothetical protein VJC03_07595, partial [bacterium]|nr:hypothetical protein [bacterium]